MTTTLTGWIVRDKGAFYLATATDWFQLEGVSSGSLRAIGVRPESPVLVSGRLGARRSLEVDRIEPRRPRVVKHTARPRFIADPIPHLPAASDIRFACHTVLRQRGYAEVPLAASRLPEAIDGGLDRFFSFAMTTVEPSEGAVLAQEEHLLVADQTLGPARLTDLAVELISGAAAAAGQQLDEKDFAHLVTAEPAPFFCDFPEDWPPEALAALTAQARAAGARTRLLDGVPGTLRVALSGGDPVAVARLLDIADSTILRRNLRPSHQWCPTWSSASDPADRAWLHMGGHRVASRTDHLLRVRWEALVTVLCGLRSLVDAHPFPVPREPRSRS